VFDVDGVLVDAGQSYPLAIVSAVTYHKNSLPGTAANPETCQPTIDDIPLFKAVGGFNDEWDLTYAACLWVTWCHFYHDAPILAEFIQALGNAGGGMKGAKQVIPHTHALIHQWCSYRTIAQIAQEYYVGSQLCSTVFGSPPHVHGLEGFHHLEHDLVPPSLLEPWEGRIAIYTGRNGAETQLVLNRAGLAKFFPDNRKVTADSGFIKPNPEGLKLLLPPMGRDQVVFLGDTLDDLRTVQNFRRQHPREPEIFFVGVTGGSMGDQSEVLFAEHDADVITASVQAFLTTIADPYA
jgi:HAD superfamily hydrolase (TIGR01548 family)